MVIESKEKSQLEPQSEVQVTNQTKKRSSEVRIEGVLLPHKRLCIALTSIFGIGNTIAKKICEALKLNPDMKPKDLTEEQISEIRNYIKDNFITEGELRKEIMHNIKNEITLNSYRGSRHRLALPVRGQRTKTNARTAKRKRGGTRKPIAGKKAPTKK